jgi:hypothetical protein
MTSDLQVIAEFSVVEVDCTIFEPLVLGSWSASTVESPDSAYDLELFENGAGKYTTYAADGSVLLDYPITWQIIKRNNMCYLSERGFWHYGFESFRSYAKELENASLTIPVTKFFTYSDFGDGAFKSRLYSKK